MPSNQRVLPQRPPTQATTVINSVELIEAAKAGHEWAFAGLYDLYKDIVFRYVYYRVPTRSLAEDLTSETFARMLTRIGTFAHTGRDFGAWLVTIARNLIADHYKRSATRKETYAGPDALLIIAGADTDSPEQQVLDGIIVTAVHNALHTAVDQLNEAQRTCIQLRFWQGLSVAQTAKVMGRNEGAIKTLQYRGVRTLHRMLAPAA